jgi:hypothetical protein
MVKLYTNKCFARYPQYHIKSLGGVNNKKDTLSVNSNQVQYSKGKGKSHKGRSSRYENRSKGTPRSVPQGNRQANDVPKNDPNPSRQNNKGKGKGRGTFKPSKGFRHPSSSQGPCSYCDRPGHISRECRKRMKGEANKQQRPIQTQNVNEIHDDELTLLMTQNVINMEAIVDPILSQTISLHMNYQNPRLSSVTFLSNLVRSYDKRMVINSLSSAIYPVFSPFLLTRRQ